MKSYGAQQHFEGDFCPVKLTSFTQGLFSSVMYLFCHGCRCSRTFERTQFASKTGQAALSCEGNCTYKLLILQNWCHPLLLLNCSLILLPRSATNLQAKYMQVQVPKNRKKYIHIYLLKAFGGFTPLGDQRSSQKGYEAPTIFVFRAEFQY